MATMQDLYNQKKDLAANQGGPDASKVDANLSIDQTPYSAGTNIAGGKGPDEAGITAAEGASINSPGNRYGFQGAVIGGGSTYLPNGYSDAKLYSSTNPR